MTQYFYPGLMTDNTRAEVMAHPMWPLVTGIIAISNQRLSVFGVTRNAVSNHMTSIMLGMGNGQDAMRVRMNADAEFEVCIVEASFDKNHYECVISSAKIPYILKKMAEVRSTTLRKTKRGTVITRKKDLMRMGRSLAEYLDKFTPALHTRLASVVNHYIDCTKPKNLRDVEVRLDSVESNYLLRMFGDEQVKLTVPASVSSELTRKLEMLHKKDAILEEARVERVAALARPKWVVGLMPTGGVMIGAVDYTAAIERLTPSQSAQIPTDLAATSVVPFRRYATLNDMAVEYRDEFMGKLVMEKVMRAEPAAVVNNRPMYAPDPDRLIPHSDQVFSDTGAVSWSAGYTIGDHAQWFMFDK